MIDPQHLNNLKEMSIGDAARAAFLHSAGIQGLGEWFFHPLLLDFYSLLVLTVGETCTAQHVSSALHLAGDQLDCEGDAVNIAFAELFLVRSTREVGGETVSVPVETFVRDAAAALAALSKFTPGERVLIGRHRKTATLGVIVAHRAGRDWYVADEPGGTPRTEDWADIWRAPLAQPTPLQRDNNPEHSPR